VATEHDSVYAFDAATATALWHVSLLGPGETTSDTRGCSQVTPEIGITSTPVIDRARGPNGVIYVVAMSKNGSTYYQRLHALDAATGTEMFGGPLTVAANFPGSGAGSAGGYVTFDAKQYEERAGLLEVNGQIVTVWTSHCDIDPYTGWAIAFDAGSLARTGVLNLTPNGSRGGMWMAGAGPAADPAATSTCSTATVRSTPR
jgi:outer membrane protein assembly factor BamB